MMKGYRTIRIFASTILVLVGIFISMFLVMGREGIYCHIVYRLTGPSPTRDLGGALCRTLDGLEHFKAAGDPQPLEAWFFGGKHDAGLSQTLSVTAASWFIKNPKQLEAFVSQMDPVNTDTFADLLSIGIYGQSNEFKELFGSSKDPAIQALLQRLAETEE